MTSYYAIRPIIGDAGKIYKSGDPVTETKNWQSRTIRILCEQGRLYDSSGDYPVDSHLYSQLVRDGFFDRIKKQKARKKKEHKEGESIVTQ